MRRAVIALGLLAPLPAHAAALSLAMDQVRTLTFPAPVATVYVGNPSIADINMIDARHAFVIGKGFGSTNIVALDHDGKQVSNTAVAVLSDPGGASTLVLNRGAQRVTYSCSASRCEMTPEPGDSNDVFSQVNGQASSHANTARQAAAGGQ